MNEIDLSLRAEQALARARRMGKTRQQLRDAPQGAVFVWCNNHTEYPMRLARQLGRTDIKVVSLQWLLDRRFLSADRRYVVIDHATFEWDRVDVSEAVDLCNAVMEMRFGVKS